ncbi:MAG: 2-phospho-L-lactate guanylyltransferase [Solirubrobacterales bacterium]|nr:2-phospho-L-lactate guanylyltransferase [Solirubrobacterales bacterium]
MSAALRTIAVLPVKRFAVAKARLATDLSSGTRRALVEAMVTDVLVALRRAKEIDQVLVVTGDLAVEAVAHGYDAHTVADPEEASHSAAAGLGIAEAVARGARRVLLVPGDTPALNPLQLDALLARTAPDPQPSLVVVPDRHGDGTNALALSPPQVITPAFGPGSRQIHEDAGAAAGAQVRVEELPSLALDVDTAEDLEALRLALADWHGNAAHTRGMLSRLGRL